MKVLTENTQDDILCRVATMQVMVDHLEMPKEWYKEFCEHLSDIAMYIGGELGVTLVLRTVTEYESKLKEKGELNGPQ